MALARTTVRVRRLMRLLIVVGCFAFFGAAVFVLGMILHSLGTVSFGNWRVFRDVSAVFAIIGAGYGCIVALDRSADVPWPKGKFFRRVNAPFLRTAICALLGGGAVAFVQAWHSTSIQFSWLMIGTAAGAVLGWCGWRWAQYVDF